MKIQKGKLSTSNAVVIGVLLVVLYLVLPTGSQKQQQNSESPSPEKTTQTHTTSDPAPANLTVQRKSISTSDTNSLTDKPAEVNLRMIDEIDKERLADLSGRNPFWTAAIAKKTRALPLESQAIATDARDNLKGVVAHQQVKSAKISLIYSSSTGQKAAIVNNEVVYPGSLISGNYLVETVHPNGLGLRTGVTPGTTSP